MKPLNLKETALKEEMKERCLAKGQYTDKNAKKKFKMLCHLEDFEIQYWELLKENKHLKVINKEYERLNKENYRGFKIINVQEYDIYELLSYKNNWNELKKWVNKHYDYYLNNEDYIGGRLCFTDIKSEMQKLERSDSND